MKEPLPVEQRRLTLILHDIRSAHNVGSIFRTADAAGVSHIYLSGYTPRPYDGTLPYTTKPERGIIKIALGAQEEVPWSSHESLTDVIAIIRKSDASIVALEQAEGSVDYKEFVPQFPLALMLGNEPRGIDPEHLPICDAIVELPMAGTKKSLNVSVAAGIALYEISQYDKDI